MSWSSIAHATPGAYRKPAHSPRCPLCGTVGDQLCAQYARALAAECWIGVVRGTLLSSLLGVVVAIALASAPSSFAIPTATVGTLGPFVWAAASWKKLGVCSRERATGAVGAHAAMLLLAGLSLAVVASLGTGLAD